MNDSITDDFIFLERNFVSEDDCDMLIAAFETLQHLAIKRQYDQLNNTIGEVIFVTRELNNTVPVKDHDKSLLKEIDGKLLGIISSFILKNIQPALHIEKFTNLLDTDFQDSGYELRKLTGSTRIHVDNIMPTVNIELNSEVNLRFGSVSIVLNETDDTIVFPLQKKEFRLTKGAILFFPPFWTHPHYTTCRGVPRYTVQTWLNKVHKLVT